MDAAALLCEIARSPPEDAVPLRVSQLRFFALAGSVNIYAIPIDLYGPARSGLAIATLVFAFGVLQTIISPVIGYLADHHLYTAVVWIVTLPPLLTIFALRRLEKYHRMTSLTGAHAS